VYLVAQDPFTLCLAALRPLLFSVCVCHVCVMCVCVSCGCVISVLCVSSSTRSLCSLLGSLASSAMGWLRLVGSIK